MKFSLKRVFVLVGVVAVGFAMIGFAMRPDPGRVPESMLLQNVADVCADDELDELTRHFGFEPSASWIDEQQSGYVVWRFEVSDVKYEASRASYFVLLEKGAFKSGFLIYPVESAGGGMTF